MELSSISNVSLKREMHAASTLPSISIFGLGYVGSVMAACLAHKHHRVIGVDTNPLKVEMIDSGRSPIVEADIQELIGAAHSASRLYATTDVQSAVRESEISFVCVGTPSRVNGKLDLSHIENVSKELGLALRDLDRFHWVVVRSTLLPGTTESVVIPALEAASGKSAGVDFAVIYNPEFMREGTAVADFFQPPYTILGACKPEHLAPLRELYAWTSARIFETSIGVAEMAKYASNVFHAVKVTFANELGTLSKHLGVDTQAMAELFTSDTNLNVSAAYLSPGFAFGGSCLPKDVRALGYRAKELDLRLPLLESVMPSNQEHIERAVEIILNTHRKKIGLLGLSFKAGTDDLRESPMVQLVKRLLGEGRQITIWDPDVSLGKLSGANRQYIEDVLPHIGSLLCQDLSQVVDMAEVIVIGNRAAKKTMIQSHLGLNKKVVDLVNLEKGCRPNGLPGYEGICW
jgi:GDP-mannose 6-dehydrogenase